MMEVRRFERAERRPSFLKRLFSFLWRIDEKASWYDADGANNPTPKRTIWGVMITAVLLVLAIWLFVPAWTLRNVWLVVILMTAILLFGLISGWIGRCVVIDFALLAFLIVGGIAGSTLVNAPAYSRILAVTEGSIEDIPSVEDTSRIALMDTDSARRLGDREIGALADIVSQYDVSKSYSQINISGHPMKVAALEHSSFFKWLHNRYAGAPGYVEVDPVRNNSDYVALERGMIYTPSAFFGQDLARHLRGLYPSLMFDDPHFEVDEEGRPWYVAPTYTYTIGLWGGKQVTGAILCDPCTGRADWYQTGAIPEWVDFVFDGDLICTQYNWSAQLMLGWLNSWIGQRECRKVTTGDGVDYGFLAIGDDIWIYTGVTSVNGDASNIGFLLSNQRTEETKFVTQSGANEFSAMAAAEGEVQEKGYVASFPSLVKFGDQMAYLMVLKDAAGLVKMYAAVGVDQYNIVAATSVQNDTVAQFRQMLNGESVSSVGSAGTAGPVGSGFVDDNEWARAREAFFAQESEHATIEVLAVGYDLVVIGGETYVFLGTNTGEVYFAKYTDVTQIAASMLSRGVNSRRFNIETDGVYFVFAE